MDFPGAGHGLISLRSNGFPFSLNDAHKALTIHKSSITPLRIRRNIIAPPSTRMYSSTAFITPLSSGSASSFLPQKSPSLTQQRPHLSSSIKSPFQRPTRVTPSAQSDETITILDYGAGNVRSLENAVRLFTSNIRWAESPSDILSAEKLIFPGVGSFGAAMENLHNRNFANALKEYIRADRPFLGICLGLHTLFDASEESPDIPGLGILPGTIRRFQIDPSLSVPHIGWNTIQSRRDSPLLMGSDPVEERYYFVHSFCAAADIATANPDAVLATTSHGEEFVSILQQGRVCATQFHPEKSGPAGLRLIRNFIETEDVSKIFPLSSGSSASGKKSEHAGGLAKRVVACLDVRENDAGDLVVTKGDQYDVRESSSGAVRNLGKPVDLAHRYFEEGADEVTFLNITSFRGEPVGSAPMIEVLQRASARVFVPLTIGGGIRDYTDSQGRAYTALDVAAMYFRAGADKISLGSDAVYAAERYLSTGVADGTSSLESISRVYGAQAVVVSVDPQKVYVDSEEDTDHATVKLDDGRICWYQCTVKGGREGRNIDVVQLATASEALGAGEILLNSMDQDGQNQGYDHKLIRMVKEAVSIPVIASSGAGKVEHFTECFDETNVEAALAAGIFHREEVSISEVKEHMKNHGTSTRTSASLEDILGKKNIEMLT